MLKLVCIAILLSATALAQSGGSTGTASPAAPAAAQSVPSSSPQPADDLAQMQQDLNRLDGLLNNMSAEIEFLHDQNLQILLRTNSQMWTILIRDMRTRLAREQQHRAASPESPAPKSDAPPAKH